MFSFLYKGTIAPGSGKSALYRRMENAIKVYKLEGYPKGTAACR